MAAISKAEYLKKYLSENAEEKKKKKRRKQHAPPAKIPKSRIVDDDVDLKSLLPENLSNTLEEDVGDNEPTVAEFVDERPDDVKLLERYRTSGAWRVMGDDDDQNPSCSPGQNTRHDSDSDTSPPRRKRHDLDSDTSPPHRKRHDSDSDPSPPRRKRQGSDSDPSPPRRKRQDSDSDPSPPRRKRQNFDASPSSRKLPETRLKHSDMKDSSKSHNIRKKSRFSDIDISDRIENSKYEKNSRQRGETRKRKGYDSESDPSPPRRQRYDSDQLPPRRQRHSSDQSSPRRQRHDSDQSPPRRQRHDSDQSPPRRQRHDSDQSPPRRQRHDSDQSPPRRQRHDSDQSPPRRQRHYSDQSPPRRKRYNSDSDQSPPRKGKEQKTLAGKKAGLSSARDMRREAEELRKKEENKFNMISDDKLGKGAATVFRDRKSGRKRDLDEERRLETEENKRKAKENEKYEKWNKGLKQGELQNLKREEALHEAAKPMARYKDDDDLDKMLREMDRAEDPMLAFIKKKKTTGEPKKEKPRYKGPAPPPNRFGIAPGYRWDGVDRSNGFEKQVFAQHAEKRARADQSYKWSVEDM